MKGFIKEFKEFISSGSVLDMAIGIIMGAAVKELIDVLVEKIVMPIVSIPLYLANKYGGLDINSIYGIEVANIGIGAFIEQLVKFIFLAFGVFVLVKIINKFRKKEAPTTKECTYCKSVIHIKAVKCPCCGSDVED